MKDKIIIDGSISQWKGNIHMHTSRSDGHLTPKQAVDAYRNKGYDFIMMSDHEIYWNSDEFDTEDFLVLGGTETSIKMNPVNKWLIDYRLTEKDELRAKHYYMHYCCIKDESADPNGKFFDHDYIVPRMTDRGIDSWNQQVQFMREHNNIVVINHPHWSRMTPELMMASNGFTAFEVWNTGNVFKCGGKPDTEIWDYCLRQGKRILAVAADDAHAYTTDLAAGFTMIISDKFTKSGICSAFKCGDFYASCGPIVHDMRIEDGILKMKFSPARHVIISAYDGDGTNFGPYKKHSIESIEWKIDERLKYIRPMVEDKEGNTAWLQPIFIEDLL